MGIEHQTEQSNWLWTGGHYRDDSPMPRFCPEAIGARSFPQEGAKLPTSKMMDLANICLKDTAVSARGAKSCQVRGQDGTKITFTLGTSQEPVTTPFGASSFAGEEGGRKTLEFSLSAEQEKEWAAFDELTVSYLAKNSYRLFKAIKTEEQIRENYRSPVQKKGDYRATLRCKVNVDGSHPVRCWNCARDRVELPEDLRDTELVAKVMLAHLWQMSKEFGFVINCTDLQIRSSSAECPFEEAGAFGGA
jgi:hypothetical protein